MGTYWYGDERDCTIDFQWVGFLGKFDGQSTDSNEAPMTSMKLWTCSISG